ncbi:uncharacterized protein PV07_09808 [Cladophialophora immunda]|uniref:Zn(2)-C6 fungal-type domain-containing protein n=1 Tax=Cladophialophora immunda TaxID=569365 RepID=A0A0D2BYA2_9EURO|nr:uncharacterized protein PV07_09808 [Cladophialophora immunda]KIW24073.1 hypothetical protein PV07_09808 [Cladophialophora immunda]
MSGQVPKLPRAACSSCHARKIKCDRRPGSCTACSKTQISCRYPPSEQILKRRMPRGPYKKRKSHRERELEDLVKTMAQKCNELEDAANAALNTSPHSAASPDLGLIVDVQEYQNEVRGSSSPKSVVASTHSVSSFKYPERSRLLSEEYTVAECPNFSGPSLTTHIDPEHAVTICSELPSTAPLNSWLLRSQVFELWHIYRSHIDPVIKLIHCPSFSEQILLATSHSSAVDSCIQALVFSICYAAVDVLSAGEVETRFQLRKDMLAFFYKQRMERALGEAASRQKPSLHVLQALVLHVICLFRRLGGDVQADTALFDRAVSEARLLLPENGDSHHENLSLLETQIFLRCWWALYVLDYHGAAKRGWAPSTTLHSQQVALPLNLNDIDLSPTMQQLPVPRTSFTEMSYFLVVVELTRLEAALPHLKTSEPGSKHPCDLGSIVNERVRAVEINFLWHCETSRHIDWLLLLTAKAMLNPIEIRMLRMGQATYSIDKSLTCTANADLSERTFSLALDVIECWYILKTNPNLTSWSWYTDIFHHGYDVNYIKSELANRPVSEQRTRAQTLLELGVQ